jgi:hypothetical protein
VNTQAAPSATVAPTVWRWGRAWPSRFRADLGHLAQLDVGGDDELAGQPASQSAGTTASAVVGSAMPSPGATGRKKV